MGSIHMQGRLIPLATASGVQNMSIDQALAESVDATRTPTLRFYQWSEPTLSLGYFQQLASRSQHVASRDATVVRRSTGGGAILHHHELTYSIAVPNAASIAGGRLDLYRDVHRAISDGLANWGVQAVPFRLDPVWSGAKDAFLCFQRRTDEDLVVSGYKVLGSAQRRSRNALLQHGSLLYRASSFAPELPGVFDLSSRELSFDQLTGVIAQNLAATLKFSWQTSELTQAELTRAQEISESRFRSDQWQNRR
ncbi:MAG: lipoate--protein ligase family protein [Pirellulaceae bacterium]|nr:lipoate--protein ligase family protein [Pirellulaceae bacterium]